MGILASILNDNNTDGGNIAKKIKNGTFKIVNEETNVGILNQLTDVLKIVPRMNRMENKYLCTEYIKFCRNCSKYNHEKFLKNLDKNKEAFALVTQENGKLKELFNKFI
jgi:hypothetical protein